MTVHVTGGRTMWREAPTCTITEANYGEDLFILDNAEMQVTKDRGNEFRIMTRHMTATDVEHDSSFIFIAEGAGLMFDSLAAKRIRLTGVIMTVKYYPVDFPLEEGQSLGQFGARSGLDSIELCKSGMNRCKKEPHLLIPYHPPQQKFKARLVSIDMDYYEREKPA